MIDGAEARRFEAAVLPHLDAAYNLARWLMRNDEDAQDVVQEAWLRAFQYFASFRGDNGRPWWLRIVRNTCYSWLRDRPPAEIVSLDDDDDAWREVPAPAAEEPLAIVLRSAERAQIDHAIRGLPVSFRDVLVLREMEELSYAQIAALIDVPIGTVMSRLARARALMRQALAAEARPVLRSVAAAPRGGPR